MKRPEFNALYAQGFARVAACTPVVVSADPAANAAAIIDLAKAAGLRIEASA